MKRFSFKVALAALGFMMNTLNANAATTALSFDANGGTQTYALMLIALVFMIFVANRRRNDLD